MSSTYAVHVGGGGRVRVRPVHGQVALVDAVEAPETARSRLGRGGLHVTVLLNGSRRVGGEPLASSALMRAEKPTGGVVHVEHAGVVAVGELLGLAGT